MRAETTATAIQPAPAAARCANCGEELRGEFCHACGEKRPDSRDLSFGHFARRTLEGVTDFEHSKFFHTVRALMLRPGFLTEEYFAGRRGRYYTPLKIFVVVFALSFLLYTMHKGTSVYDVEMLVKSDPYGNVGRAFDMLAQSKKVETSLLLERINERLQKLVGMVQHLPVVLLAFVMVFLYWTQGRYLAEHLVFTLHLLSFAYALAVVLWPLAMWLGIMNPLVLVLSYVLQVVYFYLALKRFYRQTARTTLLKALLLYVAYFVVMAVSFYFILGIAIFNAYRAS